MFVLRIKEISIISLLFMSTCIYAQIDTSLIATQLARLTTSKDHKLFWQNIYEIDQSHRGKSTVDSLDKLNMIKATMYFNKYGYPDRTTVGSYHRTAQLVWKHTRFPNVKKYTFPLVWTAFVKKYIRIDELRFFYLAPIYNRSYADEGYKKNSIYSILEKLNPKLNGPILIDCLLTIYDKEESLINQKMYTVGCWETDKSIQEMDEVSQRPFSPYFTAPIEIWQARDKRYFMQRLNVDFSHYPQALALKDSNTFRYADVEGSQTLFKILPSGDLEIRIAKQRIVFQPTVK